MALLVSLAILVKMAHLVFLVFLDKMALLVFLVFLDKTVNQVTQDKTVCLASLVTLVKMV